MLVFIISILSYTFIPAIASLIYVAVDGNPATYIDVETDQFIFIPPVQENFIFHISLILVLAIIWLSVKFILKRPLRTLITRENKIDWKKIFWSFKVFSILFLISIFIGYIISPEDVSLYKFKWIDYVFVFFITLFLTPIQTTLEELMFRGILLQWIGKIIKNPFLLAFIIGGIFGGLHFANPEMNSSAFWVGLDYVFVGFMLTYISAKTGNLEFSIAAHAANNMWIYWLITMDDSIGEGLPALFYVNSSNPAPSTILNILLFICFYYVIYKKYLKEKSSMKK
ncbi:CPBP family intramembrane metalloprotease [Bacillus sp. V3B]|uniref:CPBP family intramembrane glutamic endopeptidase n=1 Tax=Bacillus sp. V3B TaxID=2804915 RepID=UPI002109B9F3|nr:CPBP family glutamic-type intramembrane protease [Bacillus sp. V3B]MCQ6276388.1 CPBP family intramembrane metalloprotease [Bacillus sp. V3B]